MCLNHYEAQELDDFRYNTNKRLYLLASLLREHLKWNDEDKWDDLKKRTEEALKCVPEQSYL